MSDEQERAGAFIDACIEDLDEARRLFAADPNVVYLTKIGSPILHWMVIEDFQIGVQRLLEEFQVDVEHRDESGLTALHHASFVGRLGCARLLLQHGADANAVDQSLGDNCLHKAVQGEHSDVTSVLLQSGAKADYQLDSITTIGHAMASWLPESRQMLLEELATYGVTLDSLMRSHGFDKVYDSPAEAYMWAEFYPMDDDDDCEE